MKFLLDTQLLLWAADRPDRLSKAATDLLELPFIELFFSPASLWEIVVKTSLGRPDFQVDASVLRRALIDSDYVELPITSAHALAVGTLPPIHKDPFDRILIAQAMIEGITLLTADSRLVQYPGPVQRV
ncbi:type II toxin-antitoxin system VapC family toxin [Chelativorans sp.]|uniref:type II toxin-antitoxin system VapC family toxin n=1 Tax=Chelativorans sp. TaxID=2203393 RepID=UPI0028121A5A|nr:type II toxin-antitoxin system VapC family toxin [Chelativorans sp.]